MINPMTMSEFSFMPRGGDIAPGVGDELEKIFMELKVIPKDGCDCESLLREMNQLGVEGCRRERGRLAAQLKSKQELWGANEKIGIGIRALIVGTAWKLDVTDIFGSLIDLAIQRVEGNTQ